MSLQSAQSLVSQAANACIDCGLCTQRCLVLEEKTATGEPLPRREENLTAGSLARLFAAASSGEEVAAVAAAHPAAVFATRRCFMCGYCTLECPADVSARSMFTATRELLTLGNVVDMGYFSMTQVDLQWHCFSAYRAVYGIWYVDLPQIEDAPALGAEALFFPGCPLSSYSQDLTRQAFAWLQEAVGPVVFTDACCGSPLKTAGRGDRAQAHKDALVARMRQAGIKRVVCVCPGCVDELRSAEGGEDLEFVALPQLMADAGVRVQVDQLTNMAPLDSCHDRDGMFGVPLRTLLDAPNVNLVELAHHGREALCCGGAGSVSAVDPAFKEQRINYLLDGEAAQAQADLLVSNCPTCTYTHAQKRRADAKAGRTPSHAVPVNYLELVFPGRFDWDQTFDQLEGMWSGEYAAWVRSVLL